MRINRVVFIVVFALIFLVNINVKAKETYTNGIITLTEKEYNFVKDFYGLDYFKSMNEEDYLIIKQMEIDTGEVEIRKIDDVSISPCSTSISSKDRNLSIAKSCQSTYCNITILSIWSTNPTIRSYEVIGARFKGVSLYSDSITTLTKSSQKTIRETSYQKFSNGLGASILLPSGNNLVVQQTFKVRKGGTVYGSYQHAIKNVSLATSKSYYISITGYGNEI